MHFSIDSKAPVNKLDGLHVSNVKKLTYHPSYDTMTHVGDIVLLQLEERQRFNKYPFVMVGYSLQELYMFVDQAQYRSQETGTNIGIFSWNPDIDNNNLLYTELDKHSYYDTEFANCPPSEDASL